MGFALFIIASILYLPLTLINIIIVMIKNVKSYNYLGVLNKYFYQTAIDIDRFGNSNFKTLWNSTLIKSNGYMFGNIHETISSVLGKNQKNNTLTRSGKILVWILNTLDKNHCINSIEDNL